ncbi:hypothetical protein GCM10011360_08730 [Primorskyibacter flagellatus]|uniref:Tat pathway signal sequence domain protein n=1 Tax=Primorskyibacter flagellatus TaxID=1387277 RepID=A0A917EBY8_9RHOB|nr:hypothetical protein [Primorskyibacter flagellatus]GGE22473.1 hypothetical protein GCM10011360_08730 [Primorskyibacter flagellatus]
MSSRPPSLPLALGLALIAAAPAPAQDTTATEGLVLELNRISEGGDGTCQMVFFGQNNLPDSLAEITLRLAVIDANGVFQNMLALPLGALDTGKRRFAQYNLPLACADISEIVVNDVATCKIAGSAEDSGACLSGLTVSSRTDIALGL